MQFLQFCKTNCTHHLCTHSVIQDDRNKRFLCTTNHRIDHIKKRFHEDNSIMSELFSWENLLLSGMQGNNGLLARPFKKFPKSPIRSAVLTFNKRQICSTTADKCLNEHY